MKRIGKITAASVTAFALGASIAGGVVVANADAPLAGTDHRPPGELVTGADSQKAIDAALAAVPGTADHAHKTPDGQYLVMVTTADNERIVVRLDADFTVVDQQEMTGRGPGGHRGPGMPTTGEDRTKASDAAIAAVPGATVLEVFTRDKGFAVLVRTDAGKKKVVLLDENFAVTSIKADRKGRGKHGHHGKEVTGEAFTKAEAAATAEVEGTVLDVHKKGSKYYAMVRKADGSMVVVVMNAGFQVTGTKTFTMHKHGDQPTPSASSAA